MPGGAGEGGGKPPKPGGRPYCAFGAIKISG